MTPSPTPNIQPIPNSGRVCLKVHPEPLYFLIFPATTPAQASTLSPGLPTGPSFQGGEPVHSPFLLHLPPSSA